MKTFMQRIDELEKQMSAKMSDPQVRQVIIDKVEPIQASMERLENKMDRIIDMLIKKE